MARRPATAAECFDLHATEVAVILAELAESAGIAGRAWALAAGNARTDPESALEDLATVEVQLHHMARLEIVDSLRFIRAAMDRLDRELADDGGGAGSDRPGA